MNANSAYQDLHADLGEEHTGDERLQLYKAFKAVTGLGDPISVKLQQRGVRGLLKHVFGDSPKGGMYQRRVLGAAVDTVGRGVITPNPSLNMDQIGLPENKAWILYRPFIMRHLVRRGMGAMAAAKSIENKGDVARKALIDEMARRPVIINRAPVLHRYGMMAAWPILTKGNTLQIPPIVTAGFNADFDGDQQIGSVIIAVNAVDIDNLDAITRMFNLEGNRMASYSRTSLPTLETPHTLFVVNLQDFPHGELLTSKIGERGRIDLHAAVPGVKVLAYDDKAKRLTWATVSHWSKHYDRMVELVNLSGGYQIVTDDDPRAVYGIASGTLTPVRHRPVDALQHRMLVPRTRSISFESEDGWLESIDGAHSPMRSMKDRIPLNVATGYFIGAACGDGWVTGPRGEARNVCLAGVESAITDKWSSIMAELFEPDDAPSISSVDGRQSYGVSTRIQCTSVALATWLKLLIGAGADNKHLPSFFLTASREFRLGLFAGLMDTDGSISLSRAKRVPQLMASYQSNSLRLSYEVKLLAASLGVSGRITESKTPVGRPCWMLAFSNRDIQQWHGRYMVHPDKLSKLYDASEISESTPSLARHDIVPVSSALALSMRQRFGASRSADKAHKSMYSSLYRAATDGCMTRLLAKRLIACFGRDVVASLSDGEAWLGIVDCVDITWHAVESVERTGIRETGYDLTVPGYETFATADGIVLSNTMSFHVPVSEDAVQDAVNKMMPSRNLQSVTDFDVHYYPRQEFLHGLHLASTAKKKGVKTFLSRASVLAAYKRGELSVGDQVNIGS
jgi:hypothetical protein